MINIFFTVKPEQAANYHMSLVPDGDVLPLQILNNSFEIYRDEDKAIIMYRPDKLTIAELQSQTGCADPLSQEAVDLLGITGTYIGRSYSDIWVKYPELEGTQTVETEEGPLEVDIVRRIALDC